MTLFPYTTLFRSLDEEVAHVGEEDVLTWLLIIFMAIRGGPAIIGVSYSSRRGKRRSRGGTRRTATALVAWPHGSAPGGRSS
jgi:hypothetical protein